MCLWKQCSRLVVCFCAGQSRTRFIECGAFVSLLVWTWCFLIKHGLPNGRGSWAAIFSVTYRNVAGHRGNKPAVRIPQHNTYLFLLISAAPRRLKSRARHSKAHMNICRFAGVRLWTIYRAKVTDFNAIYQPWEGGLFDVCVDWQRGSYSDRLAGAVYDSKYTHSEWVTSQSWRQSVALRRRWL